LLAQESQRQAARPENTDRGDDARGRAEERRGGHRLSLERAGRGGRPAHARVQARLAEGFTGGLLDPYAGAVGSQVAPGRPARAAGGAPRDRPAVAQPGRDARLLEAHWLSDPPRARVLEVLRAGSIRSREGAAAPGRGRLSERLRRGRPIPVAALLRDGRG